MTSLSLVIHASANAANSPAPFRASESGGQKQKGGSEVTDEAVVHHANIRGTVLN